MDTLEMFLETHAAGSKVRATVSVKQEWKGYVIVWNVNDAARGMRQWQATKRTKSEALAFAAEKFAIVTKWAREQEAAA